MTTPHAVASKRIQKLIDDYDESKGNGAALNIISHQVVEQARVLVGADGDPQPARFVSALTFGGACRECGRAVRSGDPGYWWPPRGGVAHQRCYEEREQ